MKKILFTLSMVICLAVASFGQGRFSVGADLALPSGDWADFVGAGFGGSVRYEAPINDNLNWMASVGFLSFGEKDDSGLTYTAIPLLGGIKYYFTESFNGFYAGAELGLSFDKAKVDLGSFGTVEASETEFAFAPQVGYHLSVIDLSLRYLLLPDANSIGFRVAYVFGGN